MCFSIHIGLPVHSVEDLAKRVNRYFTPLRSRQSSLTHSTPSDKKSCHRQLIFRLSLRLFVPHSVHFATCHHLNYKSTIDKLILFI